MTCSLYICISRPTNSECTLSPHSYTMKSITLTSLATLALVAVSNAYPNIARHLEEEKAASQSKSLFSKLKKRTGFDAKAQYISNQGAHAFVPPGSSDQRGPCPGLNAMANHNYLPHNGVATISQFVSATNKVFGMGLDLGLFLATYGALVDGDLTSWSIGGPTGLLGSIAGLGTPQGISGSHNKYEGDGSPTRGDLYQYGNDYKVQVPQFQALYDLGKASNSYDLDVLTEHRANRFQQSISENPYFFYGPFSGVIVTPAAYTFIYRFMGNKSAEYPEGYLDGEVLKSFFAITGTDGNFKYTPGYEKIPDNWYTRNALDPYGILQLNVDTDAAGLQHPEFLVPGGNTGTVNSYLGLDPSDLSGGVVNAGNLLENNNAVCLAYQATVQFLPDLLSGVADELLGAIDNVTTALSCPTITKIDESQFNNYPGYTKLGSNGQY